MQFCWVTHKKRFAHTSGRFCHQLLIKNLTSKDFLGFVFVAKCIGKFGGLKFIVENGYLKNFLVESFLCRNHSKVRIKESSLTPRSWSTSLFTRLPVNFSRFTTIFVTVHEGFVIISVLSLHFAMLSGNFSGSGLWRIPTGLCLTTTINSQPNNTWLDVHTVEFEEGITNSSFSSTSITLLTFPMKISFFAMFMASFFAKNKAQTYTRFCLESRETHRVRGFLYIESR